MMLLKRLVGWYRGFGTGLITAPSQLLLGPVLKALRVPKVNYAHLGFSDYSQLVLHILVSTIIVYFLGAGLHWLGQYVLRRF